MPEIKELKPHEYSENRKNALIESGQNKPEDFVKPEGMCENEKEIEQAKQMEGCGMDSCITQCEAQTVKEEILEAEEVEKSEPVSGNSSEDDLEFARKQNFKNLKVKMVDGKNKSWTGIMTKKDGKAICIIWDDLIEDGECRITEKTFIKDGIRVMR